MAGGVPLEDADRWPWLARLNALLAGNVDMIGNLSPKNIPEVEANANVEPWSVPSGAYMDIVARVDRGPGKNPDFVREAAQKFGSQCIVVAIDAKSVTSESGGDQFEVGGNLVSAQYRAVQPLVSEPIPAALPEAGGLLITALTSIWEMIDLPHPTPGHRIVRS